MDFLPKFSLSYFNGFWFSLLFIITNIVMIKIYPSHFKHRVLARPEFKSLSEKYFGTLNFLIFQGLIFIVCFIPMQFDSIWFVPGLVLFLIAYFLYLQSLIAYAKTNQDKPVTTGIYQFSRNPQQLTTILMWIAIGFILNTSLLILITLLQLATVYPTFLAQDQYCINKYGDTFVKYKQEVPAYFKLFPGGKSNAYTISIILIILISTGIALYLR